jgi:uncharacterized protein (TIGR03000 family)
MLKRYFSVVGAGALLLVLASAGTSHAQMGGFWGGWGTMSPWGGTGNWAYWPGGVGMNYVPGIYTFAPNIYTGPYNYNIYGYDGFSSGFGYRGMGLSTYPGYPFGYVPSATVITPMTYVACYPPVFTTRAPVIAPATELVPEDQPATVEVVAPADAVVTFDGHPTSQASTHRIFETPPLAKGKSYYYTVEATFEQNGKRVTKRRRVEVFAGGRTLTVFSESK